MHGLAKLVAAPQHAIEHLRDARAADLLTFGFAIGSLFVGHVEREQLRPAVGRLNHREVTQVAHDRARELNFVDPPLDRRLD